jgi:uncharacterized membrane protein YdjX (TVP38/TMEM64 family)
VYGSAQESKNNTESCIHLCLSHTIQIKNGMQRYKKILLLGLIVFVGSIFYALSADFFTLEYFKMHRQQLLMFVENHYISSLILYILFYILVTTAALPISTLTTLIGGFLFGPFMATLATNIGATTGGTFIFLLVRYFFGESIQKKYHDQLSTFNVRVNKYGANYLLFARLLVFIPFFIVNICAGLTKIPLSTFIWTTSLGIIPGSFVYAYAGKQIGSIAHLSDIFSGRVIMAFALLITLSAASILVKKYVLAHKKELP